MKLLFSGIFLALIASIQLRAGESSVTYVYQILNGLASSDPLIVRVYCHDYYSHSGIPPFGLIAAPNIPPTDSPEALEDHNIASASGITIGVTSEEPWVVTINASKALIPQRFGATIPELLKLISEAVSKTASEWDISDYKISLISPPKAEQDAAANP